MSQTLFLKSNILHIRTNEGEFEVSNPETAGIMQNGKFFLWHTDSNGGYKHTESEGVDCEWPYSYELIDKPNGYPDELCARLIPEQAESAYKEFEGKDLHIVTPESPEPQEKGHDCEFFLVTDVSVYACECDPHHILIDNQEYVAINKITKANPVSAPSESQEEMWDEIYNNAITWHSQEFNKEYLKRFTITRNP